MRILFFTYTFENVGFDPLNIMALSAVLKQRGHETSIVVDTRNRESLKKEISAFRPDILAYSATTGMHRHFLDLNRSIRSEYDAFSVFGGPHPTFFPEIIDEPHVDAIGIGECDIAFAELADALANGSDHTAIPNIHAKRPDGTIALNPLRPLVEDLDELPFADRKIMREKRRGNAHGIVSMMAGRGCVYRCTYCFNHAFNKLYGRRKASVRFRSVPNLIEEAKEIKSAEAPRMVFFADDCLIVNKKWLREFAEVWPAEIGLPFACSGRYNLHDEENMALLEKAGCMTIYAAVETGDDGLRNGLLKRNMSREQILRGAEMVKKHNIALLTQSILALPHSTLESDLETLRLVAKCRPAAASSTVFMPMPRTELGELAIREGLFDGDPDKIPRDSMSSAACLKLPDAKYQTRLHSIFSIAAESGIIRALLPVLLRLPIEKPGVLLNRIWKGYCAKFRLYPKLDYSFAQTIKYSVRYVLKKGD